MVELESILNDLVIANRILANENVVDAYGHVSVRHPRDPQRFFLARSLSPERVERGDIMEFDLDSAPVDPRGRTMYIERFIHGEVFKARPDVTAIVHHHSPSVIPFGVVAVRLEPIYHMSSFLSAGVPVFEIRESGGPATDMLVRNSALGAALATTLGDCAVALLRGHGNVVVGGSIREVVFRAVYTEVNAKLATEALRLGQGRVTFLNAEEAKASTVTNRAQIGRAWELWKAQALAR